MISDQLAELTLVQVEVLNPTARLSLANRGQCLVERGLQPGSRRSAGGSVSGKHVTRNVARQLGEALRRKRREARTTDLTSA
jgi:hypothetical protein